MEEILVLDPRCVVIRESDSSVIYTPRQWMHLHTREMRRWLNEHVAWPGDIDGDIMFFERDRVGVGGLKKLRRFTKT